MKSLLRNAHAQVLVPRCVVLVIAAIGAPLYAQIQGSTAGLPQAHIDHGVGHATLTAIDARPLDKAVTAIRQEYGWLIDYEDPVYSDGDLTQLGPGDWKSPFPHRPGLRRPAGGKFTTTYPERPIEAMNDEQAMEQVLAQTVRDYAQSGNPGKFTLLHTAHGRYDLVGGNGNVTAVLDTPVSIAARGEPAFDFLTQMLTAVQIQTGHTIGLGLVPTNLLTQCTINQSFSNTSARWIILATVQACSNDLVWQFLYDANQDTFLLNIDAAVIVYRDAAGVRKLGPWPHFQ